MREYIPDGYGLSKNRMKELYAYCKQYDEWLRMTASSDATVQMKAKEKVEKIENAAHEASGKNTVLYKCLLKCVTQGIAYEYMDVPLGRAQFYKMRRLFFFLLDKEV